MLKIQIIWELETGERFEEWTRPIELSLLEKEYYNGKSYIKVLKDEAEPSVEALLFLAHKIQQRITNKIENFDLWKKKVLQVTYDKFEYGNFTKPEVSGD